MVTGEFYTKKDLFPGFGRPFVFYAEILKKLVKSFQNTSMYFKSYTFLFLNQTFSIAFFLELDVHQKLKMLQGLL